MATGTEKKMNKGEKFVWCSIQLDNGELHYVLADIQQAVALCMNQGYTVDIPEHKIPPDIREEWYRAKGIRP